jgi:hypothetical protein
MATNEIEYVKTHAHPRMNYHRSSTEPEMPEEVLTLLERYLQLSPAMVPPKGPEDTLTNTLAPRLASRQCIRGSRITTDYADN